jgi:hypothetical protein
LLLFIGMVFTIPEDFMQKKSLPENTTKLEGMRLTLF